MRSGAEREGGFALIEVIVSAALLVVVAVGVLAGFDAASHASGTDRARSIASALAQQDQERMRAQPPTQLLAAQPDHTSVQSGTRYTVHSTATWQADPTPNPDCGGDAPTTDYVRITSTVSWPRMPVKPVSEQSLIAVPPSPVGGKIVVQVEDRSSKLEQGTTVALSGGRTATAQTSAKGCVVWDNLTAGSYTVTLGPTTGYVESKTGLASPTYPVTVADGHTVAIGPLRYDKGATVRATFATTIGTATYAGTFDRITAAQPGMTAPRHFGTTGTFAANVDTTSDGGTAVTPLFPFSTPYAFYAGDCSAQDPTNNPPGSTNPNSVTVNPGDALDPVVIKLPPVDLTVTYNKAGLNGANVLFTQTTAGCPSRTFGPYVTQNDATRNTQRNPNAGDGRLAFPALPYGTYNVCAEYYAPAGTQGVTAGWYVRRGSQPLSVTSPNGILHYALPFDGSTASGRCP